ncbi:efflux RND transporter periplasmic adaptor subunit [bacterium]|nr:efflux RND transporter periplasmic adaptor subunit [bacterium]
MNPTVRIFHSLTAFALLAACSAKQPTDELSKLRKEKDSLETVKTKINQKLAVIDGKIAKLDTTRKFALVTTLQPEKGAFNHFVSALGEVKSDKNVLLLAEASGTIESVPVKVGDYVRQGQLLVSVDAAVVERNIDEVRVQLDLAKTIYAKREALWKQNIGSEVEYLQAKNNKESLETRLKTLESQLAMSRLKAPFDGYVDELQARVGEMASPASPLVRLVSLREVYIEADLSESYLKKVRKGSPVVAKFPALGTQLDATVSQVSSFIKPENRTFRIRIDLKNAGEEYKPNLIANLEVRDYASSEAISVPNRVIQQAPDGRSYVYTVTMAPDGSKGRAERVYIEIGQTANNFTEVLSGLKGDEYIVDKGARSIKDQETVAIQA